MSFDKNRIAAVDVSPDGDITKFQPGSVNFLEVRSYKDEEGVSFTLGLNDGRREIMIDVDSIEEFEEAIKYAKENAESI